MAIAVRRSTENPPGTPFPTGPLRRLGKWARRNASSIASAVFVGLTVGSAYVGGNWTLAVYALSVWHYYLYWLAYRFGAVPLDVFKRDAIAMKSVAITALAGLYLAAPLDTASLAVVAFGLLLNGWAAAVLGSDRTYYGHEVADLPRRRISAFPYSVIAHPMLAGNVVAFGGALINADFRAHWWPLALTHVALNLGLWIMEVAVTPQRTGARRAGPPDLGRCSLRTGGLVVAAGAALGAAAGAWWGAQAPLGAGMAACAFAYAYVLYCCYSSPPLAPDGPRRIETEDSP